MTGFDDEALQYMLKALAEKFPQNDTALAETVFNLAMSYDLAYMKDAGIIVDGAFTDTYYDEDDAFEYIIEHLAAAHDEIDGNTLADLTDEYFTLHDAFMEEKGLLEWE